MREKAQRPGKEVLYLGIRLRTGAAELGRGCLLLLRLSAHDLRMSEAGSAAGVIWSFGEPALLLSVLYFVFSTGLRTGEIGGIPYGQWFLAGYLPWQLVSRVISLSAVIIKKHRAMLRQIRFPALVLPLLPAVTSLWVHLGLLALYAGMTRPAAGPREAALLLWTLLWILVLTAGISCGVSTACVIRPSLGSVINVLLQLWFWVTPLAWEETDGAPAGGAAGIVRFLSENNPLRMAVINYRWALLGSGRPCRGGELPLQALAAAAAGLIIFLKNRKEIADAV